MRKLAAALLAAGSAAAFLSVSAQPASADPPTSGCHLANGGTGTQYAEIFCNGDGSGRPYYRVQVMCSGTGPYNGNWATVGAGGTSSFGCGAGQSVTNYWGQYSW